MPGILGIIGTGPPGERSAQLDRMLASVKYDSAYEAGAWVSEPHGLWTGWTSHKGAFPDCMPLWNETKDICLIFSGEDFSGPAEMRARG